MDSVTACFSPLAGKWSCDQIKTMISYSLKSLFQSPCGEMVLRPYRNHIFNYQKAKGVSVPLRGNGLATWTRSKPTRSQSQGFSPLAGKWSCGSIIENQHYEELGTNVFQSPCGEMVLRQNSSFKETITMPEVMFQSPCGEMVLRLVEI